MFLIHLQEQLDASKTYLSAAVKNIALIREVKLSVLLRLHSISILCRQSPSKWYKRLWLSARKHLWCCDPLVTKSSQWTKKLHWNCLTSRTWIPRLVFIIICDYLTASAAGEDQRSFLFSTEYQKLLVDFTQWLSEGQINCLRMRRIQLFSVLPFSTKTVEGLFELTWRPSRALASLRVLLPEL